MEREYIVTAKTKEDLESLYNDLETLVDCEYIPNREVECVHRRPISRNTHYYLTPEEAELIRQDPRVLNVTLTLEEQGVIISPAYQLTSTSWNKSGFSSDLNRNWAMYRCVNGAQVTNWGSDSTNSQSGTVTFTSTGKNVDVVIVDGHFDPAHPEFAVNEDGTGGSRVVQFNWFSLNPAVRGLPASTYHYTNVVTKTYGVTANSGNTSNYVFSGDATGGNGLTLSATRGDTLVFNVNTSINHPFWIKTVTGTGTLNAVGNGTTTGTITNNGASTGTITWNTAGVTPGTYYYQCSAHGNMNGQIIIAAGSYINGSASQQSDNNHGCHVAGTVAGNRRGWARDANIYNINPYGSSSSYTAFFLDYIREWHNTKAANPKTGKKNPTITNHSYGAESAAVAISSLSYVKYRGTQYNAPLTAAQCTSFGLLNNGTTIVGVGSQGVPYLDSATDADIQDAIEDGIIFVAAAGNNGFKADSTAQGGGLDYNNVYKKNGAYDSEKYYHRGTYPGAIDGVICVGSIASTASETKNISSTCGRRVDVYAPGTNIISSVHSNEAGAADSRSNSIGAEVIKYTGTSMASPQVAGVLACLAEQFPRITQSECLFYLGSGNTWTNTPLSKQSQIAQSGAESYTNGLHLQGSPNNYLLSPRVRKVPTPTGATYIGSDTAAQITFPRENRFRAIKYDVNSSFEGSQQYVVDDDIYASGFIYPRRPTWHRNLT